jgi:hypothetical protein
MVTDFSPERLLSRTAEELSKLSRAGMMVNDSARQGSKCP